MKLLLAYIIRLVLRLFFFFPMEERRIFFVSHGGDSYNCNPKYIYRYLGEHYPGGFEAVWCLRDGRLLTERYPDTEIVEPYTFRYFRFALTSRVVVSNTGFSSMLPKRRGQVYMNTWHGGGSYKKSGLDVPGPASERKVQMDAGRRTDIFLSCSEDFSRNMSQAKHVALRCFAATGMPRNDLFFGEACKTAADRLRKELGLTGWSVALYAPTFRGTAERAVSRLNLDVKMTVESLEKRFGGRWKVLVRRHPYSAAGRSPLYADGGEKTRGRRGHASDGGSLPDRTGGGLEMPLCPDVSDFPDMQELLCLADVLVTDYSSCLWDYSFTYRPCFVLADDIGTYEKEHGFYTPISEWPYPVARDNRELSRRILEFDSKNYQEKLIRHHERLGSYEDGKAAERTADILIGPGGERR